MEKLENTGRAIVIMAILAMVMFTSTAVAGEYRGYVVKKGDTLWGIAKKEVDGDIASAVSKISKENNLFDPDFIIPGQTLKIKDEEYVVKKGDTLWSVAKNEIAGNIISTIVNISEENDIPNPDFIVAGQILKIRGGEDVVKKEIPHPDIIPETETIVRQERETKGEYPSKYLAEIINLPLVISFLVFIAMFCFVYKLGIFLIQRKEKKTNQAHYCVGLEQRKTAN